MITPKAFCHPETLVEGARYLLLDATGGEPACEVVTLLAYDPCPALVILIDEQGHRRRWPRQDLFLMNNRVMLSG
jgi:hypothetical protein